ncbi:M20 family metallopeptidase [Actinomadura verrucosospora]|uniref:Peptidase M20 n=1 Tax=Actinomadura verrucosospora TaxID=46165 RepID=A0A7D4AX76_ACTVE|nr:M20 family metallopeptidase [Actinomadura verrucosospora]QKG27049.1 peptidase M20 [Actinomadura verrucosospora]
MPADPHTRAGGTGAADDALAAMTSRLGAMLADLEELVTCESFSADRPALARSARTVAAQGARLLGAEPETIVVDGVPHLRWTFGAPRVLLLGHHDTVWPPGSLADRPWTVRDGVATGPGVFDMKAGLVQMFHALASLPSLDGVCVLVTGDEEVGSATSRALVEEAARGCAAAFVLEASGDGGALKTARKGVSNYEIVVHGRAAHAGLEPEKGVNSAVEIAHQILAVEAIAARAGDGTTLTPTLLAAGTAGNTVPARASLAVDVRVPTQAAQQEVDDLLHGLEPRVPGARLELRGGPNRPPLESAASAELFALAGRLAAARGLGPLRGVAVGGASDGNYTAGAGCPTLDGLGAVGGGAHADDEHVAVAEMPRRALLLADLVGAAR